MVLIWAPAEADTKARAPRAVIPGDTGKRVGKQDREVEEAKIRVHYGASSHRGELKFSSAVAPWGLIRRISCISCGRMYSC